MSRRPDWVAVAKRHGAIIVWCADRPEITPIFWDRWSIRCQFGSDLDTPFNSEEQAARAYCIHHGLEIEVLQTLAPPEKETPDADPQRTPP